MANGLSFGIKDDGSGGLIAFAGSRSRSRHGCTRPYKGESLLDFPEDYVVVDIETTGFDPNVCNIIEIAGIRYEKGEEREIFNELVQPPVRGDTFLKDLSGDDLSLYDDELDDNGDYRFVDDFITDLTGITNAMLKDAPTIKEVVPLFREFIGDSVIVGHNVNFDINFLYDNFERWEGKRLSNDFVDTMRISRRLLTLPHNRLCDVAKHYSISYEGAHRALADCRITKQSFDCLKDDVINNLGSIDALNKRSRSRNKAGPSDAVNISCDLKIDDPDNPFFEKNCVITGTLEYFTRDTAMHLIESIGGINQKNMTKKTNYLILGNNDFNRAVKGGKSTKQRKAEAYILDGLDIQIISENVFYDMLGLEKGDDNA